MLSEKDHRAASITGHRAAGPAWFVNKFAPLGDGLKKGDMVFAGSFTRPVDTASGDVIFADYGAAGGSLA